MYDQTAIDATLSIADRCDFEFEFNQLQFVQTFIALTAKVMTDILVEFLAQHPVLVLKPDIFLLDRGVLCFQRGDADTQFFNLLEQRSVVHVILTRV